MRRGAKLKFLKLVLLFLLRISEGSSHPKMSREMHSNSSIIREFFVCPVRIIFRPNMESWKEKDRKESFPFISILARKPDYVSQARSRLVVFTLIIFRESILLARQKCLLDVSGVKKRADDDDDEIRYAFLVHSVCITHR